MPKMFGWLIQIQQLQMGLSFHSLSKLAGFVFFGAASTKQQLQVGSSFHYSPKLAGFEFFGSI